MAPVGIAMRAWLTRVDLDRITLGVDTGNPTGATKLYESVGMTPELEQVVYEKSLA